MGIQAQGRTTILKINYRNTRQILETAYRMAGHLLTAEDCDDDGIPLVKPVSCGRDGPEPLIIDLPTLPGQAARIAQSLEDAHADGFAWGDMAVLCRDIDTCALCAQALARRKLPLENRRRPGDYHPLADTIKVLTIQASKGLEFPVVAIPGIERLTGPDCATPEDAAQQARVLYVALTRATHRLVLGVGVWGRSAAEGHAGPAQCPGKDFL
ncbi:3'-5' exonuclease [Verminephrobacter aporrectodeae]|uniref:3'-5' exonuclease n=1 Tax=Verminephrobacter aporrectodeae TaxID=1110389 RepID=UPI0022375DF3|nr:3'-5' exonuclease [Verminephrobacter aporrectodeae]